MSNRVRPSKSLLLQSMTSFLSEYEQYLREQLSLLNRALGRSSGLNVAVAESALAHVQTLKDVVNRGDQAFDWYAGELARCAQTLKQDAEATGLLALALPSRPHVWANDQAQKLVESTSHLMSQFGIAAKPYVEPDPVSESARVVRLYQTAVLLERRFKHGENHRLAELQKEALGPRLPQTKADHRRLRHFAAGAGRQYDPRVFQFPAEVAQAGAEMLRDERAHTRYSLRSPNKS